LIMLCTAAAGLVASSRAAPAVRFVCAMRRTSFRMAARMRFLADRVSDNQARASAPPRQMLQRHCS
jgi:hypothetical protein